MTNAQQRGRRTLLLITAIFAAPILLAAYMYFSGSTWRPAESTQYGELVSPPRTLPDINLLTDAEDKPLYGIWNLLVLADAQCDPACTQSLENIRQIRLSLGPKMTRLQTVFVPAASSAIAPDLANNHPALIIVDPTTSQDLRGIVGDYSNGQIFIVDPLGNLMMQYAPGTLMGDIRKDLGHLLQLSGIG